jgi:hypothetical protein
MAERERFWCTSNVFSVEGIFEALLLKNGSIIL